MARVEILGALCGAAVNYSGVRGAGVGVGALQGVELAGYLAGLGPEATALAMAKYMGDEQALLRLTDMVGRWLTIVARSENWLVDPHPFGALEMANVAVIEVVSPATCRRCRGVGFVAAKVCTKCNGGGHVLLSDRSVASSLDVPFETFRRKWRDRYGRVLARVQSFDADVIRAVNRQVCADMELNF